MLLHKGLECGGGCFGAFCSSADNISTFKQHFCCLNPATIEGRRTGRAATSGKVPRIAGFCIMSLFEPVDSH
ncbi:hypothetical protein ILYODFUR_015904 [Ilyodon furcidens]|uniref:Uncharacterized protein n=1 Tax=Ilyodon furcidens TaxID=33524 RepID=A0ABV0TV03_9TELE